MHRYFMYYGGVTLITMFDDAADRRSALPPDGTHLREIIGDAVDIAETFAQAYSGRQRIDKRRARPNKAIEDAEREERK